MSYLVMFILLFGSFYMTYVMSLQFIPERAELHVINDTYIRNAILNVRKLGRRGPYIINLNFTLVYEFSHNITLDIIFYEYLHNEYKRSFVEMHFKLCDMMKNDLLLGLALKNAGFSTCPVPAGSYSLSNMTIPTTDKFPYVWPFERARATGTYWNHNTGVFLGNGSIYFTFKQKARARS